MKIRLPLRKAGPPRKGPPRLKLKASVARSRRAPAVEEEDFLEEPEPNMRLSHAFVVVLVLHVIAVAGVFAFNSIKTRQAEIFSAIKEDTANTVAASKNDAPENADNPAPTLGENDPSNGGAQPPAAVPAPSTAKTHTLQPGETLTKVAATYDVSIADLEKLNNIVDPKTIRAGTVLLLPDTGKAPPPSAAATTQPGVPKPAAVTPVGKTSEPPAATSTVKDSGKVYVVVKGDNPVKIAKQFKVSYADLMKLNGNFDPKKMQIGQKLKIPGASGK